jgi:hypothetical protein
VSPPDLHWYVAVLVFESSISEGRFDPSVDIQRSRVLVRYARLGGALLKHFRDLTAAGIILSVLFAAMWTVATLALQLRRPRYRLRRVLRRPGTAACCAATVALALEGWHRGDRYKVDLVPRTPL